MHFLSAKDANQESCVSFLYRWQTLKIVVFPRENDDFQGMTFFSCRWFFGVSLQKNIENSTLNEKCDFAAKNHVKVASGTGFCSQNGAQLTSEIPKITNRCEKTWFLADPFFEQISRCEKRRFYQFLVSKGGGGRHEPGAMEGNLKEGSTLLGGWSSCHEVKLSGMIQPLSASRLNRGWKPRGGFQRLRLMPPTPGDLGFKIRRFEVWEVRIED